MGPLIINYLYYKAYLSKLSEEIALKVSKSPAPMVVLAVGCFFALI